MTEAAIVIDDVHQQFGKQRVLSGTSLSVPAGETFAFLGRNGAGKTTTIRLLLGLLKPAAGTIRVLGLDPTTQAMEVRRRVGYLAEDQTMFGWMTVGEMLRFVAPFYPTWDQQLASEYVEQFQLPADTKIRNLSKGQNVRLGLLLALAHRPELVILDDPALGLDPIMRKEFNRDLISHLQSEGRTVFYSSHLLYEVEPVADTVAILDRGHVVHQSATESLRSQVKRIILEEQHYHQLPEALEVIDIRRSGGEVAVTIVNAAQMAAPLSALECDWRIVDLNLDEIFEAYVTGRVDENPPASRSLDSVESGT